MNQKPILFLDFDRTLFDTERYYLWLGEPRKERNLALIEGTLELPDFSQFVFSDTHEFLEWAKDNYELVLLTFVKLDYSPLQAELQQKKVDGSGLRKYFSEIIVTTKSKADEAKKYLDRAGKAGESFSYIDDEFAHVAEMKKANPNAHCIRLDRGGKMTGIPMVTEGYSAHSEIIVRSLSEAKNILS